MNHIKNLTRVAIIAILALFAFGPPIQTQAAQEETDQFSCANVSEIPQIECEALVALYNGTGGPNWQETTGWLGANTPCSWYGVTCNSGHVTELDLDNENNGNKLSGGIPSAIGNLTALTYLDLSHNQLSSLPAAIGNLNNLSTLTLSSNQLSSLPAEIGNLNRLMNLWLRNNQFSSLPAEIGNLNNLVSLSLIGNQLSSLPAEFVNLNNLTILELKNNQFSSLPIEIWTLDNLTLLNLHSNQLSSLPTEIGNLSSLRQLDLAANDLSSLPSSISNLNNLSTLYLAYNRLLILDNDLHSFLTEHDADWTTTQTIAPTDARATVLGESSIELKWSAIAFQDKRGYYEISVAEGDSFTVHGTTASKSTRRYLIDGLASGATYDIRIRTYTPAHAGSNIAPDASLDDQKNELWSDYSPIISATTLGADKDEYESDNQCLEATQIAVGGMARRHTFHTTGDTDWSTFTAPDAGTYRIEVTVPDDSRANVDLYYYTDCDRRHEDLFVGTFAPGARIDVEADSPDQQFYIELRNYDGLDFGADVAYTLSVRKMPSRRDGELDDTGSLIPGPAIIVAGRYRGGDDAQYNINQVATNAYELFKAKGRNDSEIYILATDSALTGYDAPATLRNLQLAIVDWAKEELKREGVSKVLTLYLVDHGDRDKFYLDKINEEILVPDDLDEWLSTLEEAIPGLWVNVIIEACHAGSFIARRDGTISKEGRVIITSSNEDYDAYISRHGAAFSDNLITFLSQEYNLAYSFQQSSDIVQKFHSNQEPWIDANGNSEPNEAEDIAKASLRGFAEPGSLGDDWPPYIANVNMAGQRTGIHAEIRHKGGNEDIEEVWAIVYPPDYVPPTGEAAYEDDGVLNEQTLDVIEFVADGEANYVEASPYAGFTQMGIYRVVIQARDINGLSARPVTIEVDTRHWVYLPMISR